MAVIFSPTTSHSSSPLPRKNHPHPVSPPATQFESFCGSDSSNFKPDPSIDPRTESTLNKTERLQTPYTWYTSSNCRQYVKDFITTIVSR